MDVMGWEGDYDCLRHFIRLVGMDGRGRQYGEGG